MGLEGERGREGKGARGERGGTEVLAGSKGGGANTATPHAHKRLETSDTLPVPPSTFPLSHASSPPLLSSPQCYVSPTSFPLIAPVSPAYPRHPAPSFPSPQSLGQSRGSYRGEMMSRLTPDIMKLLNVWHFKEMLIDVAPPH